MADLPDVNVWVAMSAVEHPHHQRATIYWHEEATQPIAFNTLTMLGLVRVSSNVNHFGGKPLSVRDAWSVYMAWRNDRAVQFVGEPPGLGNQLSSLVNDDLVTPRTWSDAYLAAFAILGNYRLVSFDSDFERFPTLNYLRLAA